MKRMTKEAQMQANGGEWLVGYTWTGQCTTSSCGYSFGAYSNRDLILKGLEHHQKYYENKYRPHRWAYGRMG